jgi:MFS family permease
MNVARLLRLPPDLPVELRSNIIHYYLDISWWGLYAGATAAFLTIYATRIGASATQIGLLNALPSAISLILSLPFASVVRRMSAHRATWVGAFLSRFLFLPYALLPFFFSKADQVTAILVIAVLMTVPNVLVGIAFNQLLIEAVPPEWRGTVVGARNAFFSIITFVVTLISGQILTHMAFPGGYQVVFVIGFVGGIATTYHLYKIRPLALEPAPSPAVSQVVQRLPRYLPPIDGQGRRYLRVIGLLFLFNTISNMVAPLVPGVLVNTLRLPDGWISIGTALNSLIVFVMSLFIARLTRRVGNRGGTAIGAVLVAVQVIILAMARTPIDYLIVVLVGGIGSGMLSTAQYNYHLDNVPEINRSAWLSWNLLLGNAALLVGALAGPFLAGWVGTPVALVLFGILRFLTALIIYRWG